MQTASLAKARCKLGSPPLGKRFRLSPRLRRTTLPIETLDPKNSVLFLGSGFSAKATNIANEELPAGQPPVGAPS